MRTTLNKIREYEPCAEGWKKLLTYLGKTKADDEPLSLLTIIDSNGIDDALWCLRAVEGYDREIRMYAVWCARQVQHVMTDQRSLDSLDVAERYANGEATQDELNTARSAAASAAPAAGVAADATGWAARDAAWAAAWDAAWDAAWAAAWYAARAARDAAWAAARDVAAWDAARDAARYAVWSAAEGARDEMRKRQEAELRRICEEG